MVESFWRDRRVFVTGATGLLGSALVEELLARGADVTCLVRDWVPQCRLVAGGLHEKAVLVRGELEDYNLVLRALNEYEVDTVFHLGAQTIVGTAQRSARSTFEANVRGTWNLMEAVKTCSPLVSRVVVASSDKAYGSQQHLPYTEDLPLEGRFPYDASKACCELVARSYAHTYRLPVAITRCGNLYGAGDLNFNRLIPGTIRSALAGQPPVIRSDGTFLRDYFYVRDAVEAYLCLAEAVSPERHRGEAFNFGNDSPASVLDVVRLILKLMSKEELVPVVLNEATHEIREQYLDCTKARRELDWQPKWSLESGLQETLEWYREFLAIGRT